MHKASFSRLVCAGLCALLTATRANADEWTKKYTFTGTPQVHVDTNDGRIDVVPSSQNEVEVYVRTNGWHIPDDVRVSESQTGDHLEISARLPHVNFNLFPRHRSLSIELRVPHQVNLDLHTGDGAVSVQPVTGNVRVDTGDGSIRAEGIKGNVRLHTGDGGIDGSGFDGSLDADSGDGHIHVRGRFDALRLRSGDGRIDAEAADGSRMTSSWNLRSGDGSITLRLPSDFSADLDAHTGDGRITVDFPVSISGSLDSRTIRGKIGSGGPVLEVHTGDGSIHLEKL